MAAYSALLSVAQLIHDEFLPCDQQVYTSLFAKDQMISLHQHIIELQKFLEHVPDRCASMTRQLETRLTDVLYRLEDLIQSNVKGSPCPQIMPPADVTSMFGLTIEEIIPIVHEAKEMEELFNQKAKAVSVSNGEATSSTSIGDHEPGRNHVQVGISKDLDKIVDLVTSHEKSLQIISIVGMGGIGKTTLARAVYEEKEKDSHFDLCFWVTISQEHNLQDILQVLLKDQQKTAEPLDAQVHKRLRNRRFLIVMDDMWHPDAWECVMNAIPNDQMGSRVIITTRSSDVASKVDSSSTQHQMQLMNKETSWKLLCENVDICESSFSVQLPEFEGVGRRIAEKCGGLPLTIVVVGGLLKSNMTKEYWEQVGRNINEAASKDGQLDEVLSLSYNNLPARLKSCFLYMGVFPEDFRIPASLLFWLWIAQGFIKPQAPKTLEEIAEEYLEDLVERNLVMVAERRCNGKIRRCRIHDVPRELGLNISKRDKFLQRFDGWFDAVSFRNATTSQRHVSISSKRFDCSLPNDADHDNINTYNIRSLLLFISRDFYSKLVRFRLLTVLYGVLVSGESMWDQIFELTNLRLLQFHFNGKYGVVPKSVSKLQKLETLIVCMSITNMFEALIYGHWLTITEGIWDIPNLRHLVFPDHIFCRLNFPMFVHGCSTLENLQTLSLPAGDGGKITDDVLGRMPNLKKLKNVGGYVTLLPNFGNLCQLENLAFRDCDSLKDLAFPHSIRKLCLRSIDFLSWNAIWSLPNLQVLKLSGKSNDTWEPEEGQFLQLKHLEMYKLDLKCWLAESTHFPCLEKLVLRDMEDLEEIPVDMGYIDTLQKMIVNGCKNNVNESAQRIQKVAESVGNNALQLVITNRNS